MWRVRAVQRWWRRWAKSKRQERALAVAMGLHKRLGDASELRAIHIDVMRMFV